MKKALCYFFTVVILVIFSRLNVYAYSDEVYYINQNNVKFMETEYNFFTLMFYDGYQEFMTQEEFDSYLNTGMNSSLVETSYLNTIQPYATSISDNNKSLKISKTATPTTAYISVVATWKVNPTVKSYDLMGAYLENVKLSGNVTTKVSCSSENYNVGDIQKFSNGFGVSIKLPNCNNIVLSQSFKTSLGGTVYASYQHAITNISLNDSKKYTIGKSGYGNVFIFSNGINNKYDAMSGVNIHV